MATTTQDGRILKINTPLGPDFLLLKYFSAVEGLSQLFSIEAELVHEETKEGSDPTNVDPKKILGQAVSIEVNQPDETKRYFSGIVNRFSQGVRDSRFTSYEMTIVPNVWLLTQSRQSRVFQHKTVPQILKEVFGDLDVKDQTESQYNPRNYCIQYRESDWDFVSRLMEEDGIYYFFEHTADGHRMIFADGPNSHTVCSKARIPYVLKVEGEAFQSSILEWNIEHNLQSGKVTFWDHHFQTHTNKLEGKEKTIYSLDISDKLEVYDYPGEYAHNYDDIDRGGGERSDVSKVFQEREEAALIVMQALDSGYKTTNGLGTCSSMTSGHRFELYNHPVSNGKYVITQVEHFCSQSPQYVTDNVLDEPYRNEFTCISYGGGAPPFRPPAVTPKPVIRGSQTAMVVGPAGEEIFTDKYGRVKVQFHWDRYGKYDADSSCWLRVATNIAGNKWGTMFIPRIGQEVMVDFLEGDADQPIIVGCVYNPKSMPHYDLPKYKTLSYIKTHTSPGGNGFNELRFEDKKDKEQVFIHSQKRMDVRVKNSLYETCGGNRQEVIGMRTDNQPGGNLAVSVGGNHDFHVKYDEFIGIDVKRYETVKSDLIEKYEGKKVTLVTAKSEHNAREIIIEAVAKISLKVGASCIVIEPTGITIAAMQVKINSGGFGTETSDPMVGAPLDAEWADTGEPGYLDRPGTGGGRRGRVWTQARSQHHAYPPRPGESAGFTAMRNRLNTSAQGRHALEVFERNGVQVTNNPGGTAYSGNPTNSVNLDPARAGDAAPGFVHEMGHAEADHGGTDANVRTQERADYIDTQLREDAHAERSAYEAEEQMNAAGGSERYNSSTRTTYQNALASERARLQAAEPGISDEELNRRSHDAAEAAILQDYRNGNVNTGNTTPPQSYVDYWGSDHDARHGSGSPGPAPDPHDH